MSRVEATPAGRGAGDDTHLADLCLVEQWRLRNGDTSSARNSLARVREMADQTRFESLPLRQAVCVATIEAFLAMAENASGVGEAVNRLDRLLLLVPEVEAGDDPSLVGPFVVADWREKQGDLNGALAAMRRWHNHGFTGVRYLSTYLREQGRLASLAGDREGATQAYRHYLMLRSDPEPEWLAQRDSVRTRLAGLLEAATQD